MPRGIANRRTPCPECEAPLIPAEARQAADIAATGELAARVKCPDCGTVADLQANICVECGLDFRTGKKLLKPPSTAEKLQRVNRRIKKVRADLRTEVNLLVLKAVPVLGLFLIISYLLYTAMPFLRSWAGMCLAIGALALVLALLARLRGDETVVRVRQVRQEMLAPLIERRFELLRMQSAQVLGAATVVTSNGPDVCDDNGGGIWLDLARECTNCQTEHLTSICHIGQ